MSKILHVLHLKNNLNRATKTIFSPQILIEYKIIFNSNIELQFSLVNTYYNLNIYET